MSLELPEPQPFGHIYQAQALIPPSGIIYEGNPVIPIPAEEVNNNRNPGPVNHSSCSSGEDEEDNDLSQDHQEEGGSLQSRVRQRQQLFSSNMEIIQSKLKLRNREDDEYQVMGGDDENQVEGEDGEARKIKTEVETKENAPGEAKKRSMKKVKTAKKEKKKGAEERQFACGHCDYKATQKISLLRHLEVHAGKKFACEEADCGKSYRWETDLRRHQVSAHSNLTFPCPEPDCDYVGRSGRNLTTHRRSKHSGDRPDLICQICGERFSSSSYLEVHVNSRHLGHRVVCSECEEVFATKANLQRHQREKHEGGEVRCEFCDKSFSRKNTKDRHVKKSHSTMILGI